jgi:hypothetical protein
MFLGEVRAGKFSRSRATAFWVALFALACGEDKSGGATGVSSGGTTSGTGGSAGSAAHADGGSSVSHGAAGTIGGGGESAGAGASLASRGGASPAGGAAGASVASGAANGAAAAPPAGDGGVGGGEEPIHFRMPYAKSGQRLHMMGYAADGAEQFQYVEDTRFGEQCVFVQSADGKGLLCLPKAQTNLVIYADEQCTDPVVAIPASDPVAKNITVLDQRWTQCPGSFQPHRSTYRIGEEIPPDLTTFDGVAPTFVLQENGCQPWGFKGAAPTLYHASLSADDEFVSAHAETVNLGSDFVLTRIVSDDGAELTHSLASANGTACALQEDGQCVPEPLAVNSGDFVDDTCQRLALYSPYYYLDGCGDPKYTVTKDSGGVHVFDLMPASPVYWVTGVNMMNQCGHSADNGKFYDRREDVTASFKKYDRFTVGAGRLKLDVIAWQNPGAAEEDPVPLGARQASGVFRLSDGRPCSVRAASDGTSRCVPSYPSPFTNSLYADAECKQVVYLTGVNRDNPASPWPPIAAETDSEGKLKDVLPLKEYSGPFYVVQASGCSTYTPDATYAFWVADGRVDIAELPAVELKPL